MHIVGANYEFKDDAPDACNNEAQQIPSLLMLLMCVHAEKSVAHGKDRSCARTYEHNLLGLMN